MQSLQIPLCNYGKGKSSNQESIIDNSLAEKPGVAKSASLKTYKTPNVPKTFSKLLKNDNASTPKMEAARSNQPCSIKDEIKNAFGFDDTGILDIKE